MWFASIWIFTLRLPWALGADFFMRHLIDADAASNILSWRWVAGLQTAGKTYLATTDNIERYTNGRFAPKGLATQAMAIAEAPKVDPLPLPETPMIDMNRPSLLLVTGDDLTPESLFPLDAAIRSAMIATDIDESRGGPAALFEAGAANDAAGRVSTHFACPPPSTGALSADTLIAAARAADVSQIVTAYAPRIGWHP
jgi:deoxyribodipyrimidine photo-lyase